MDRGKNPFWKKLKISIARLLCGCIIEARKELKTMAKIINGKKYYWVDTIFDDELIYDIYEDNKGHRVKVISGYID